MVIMTVNIPAPTIIAFRIALNGVLRGPFYEVSIDDLFDALLAEVQALLAEVRPLCDPGMVASARR